MSIDASGDERDESCEANDVVQPGIHMHHPAIDRSL